VRPTVLWFRRDLRLADSPALLTAAAAGDAVLPLFVLDPVLLEPAGAPRVTYLYRALRELDSSVGGRLVVQAGDPVDVVPRVAAELDSASVHVSADFGPYGAGRDRRVESALATAGRSLVRSGSPYAVSPGRLKKADGTSFRVYSPYFRAWSTHGWPAPAPAGDAIRWTDGNLAHGGVPADPDLGATRIPAAGEAAALAAWRAFRDEHLAGYAERRDVPAQPGTSRLSVHLKYGCLHPRTLLAELGLGPGPERLRGELAWREFYADVLFANPASAREPLAPAMAAMACETGPRADERFRAWAAGRTGYPIVDAGMRQLAAEAWVHNRVRMIVASFLVKDLHIDWRRGARYFLRHLVDGDLASNNHGWQWVAGTGTDPAPYFRVFNPTTQGRKFDPGGDYVRRYVPELRDLDASAVHEPWRLPAGPPAGYPSPIVDHAAERREALDRYAAVREQR